ncbi:dTDP-4-amino-4,6-dideoxygalactose transaminase [Cyclobacterium xiamenense]|uniref:dTDP-4-amino-4,6-dideoxygalactose transaminase n=1 Tax=Cyclobacterium xiamenense TaxID=1297121 RepID=A0A1H6ZBQ6_9BACT|nr:aminotransferase class I/II-fold pyridoxal phosphate-dependent enzyme [Cyclobacterium xiamenense]SEJ50993.1 dTDP-4-amino-4,6-dideoxygalactose transaminase [Cyclobacterium xiamenense]
MAKENQITPLSSPHFSGNEIGFIQAAIAAGEIATNGRFIRQFEQELERQFDSPHVIALNSGTSAIHLALHLLGVGSGDEVICQSFTFVASCNPIRYLGGVPVFVDSEEKTWNMCPDRLEETIRKRLAQGKKPKVILAVNLFGMPANWSRIGHIAKKYDIPVLEDAAESLGSTIDGQFAGTFGDLGVFSFNGNKIITTGSGGALLTKNRFLEKKSRYLATQAKLNVAHYEHNELGYNYKMTNLAAGIGLAQLQVIADRIRKRRQIFTEYRRLLQGIPGLQFLEEPPGYFSNRWLTTLLIQPEQAGFDAVELRNSLLLEGIESRFLWKPMHLQPLYRDAGYLGGGVAENLFRTGLCLPSSSLLGTPELERIVEVVARLHAGTLYTTGKTV